MSIQAVSDTPVVSSIDIIGEGGDFLSEPQVRRNAATALAVCNSDAAARQLVELALAEESPPIRSHIEQALLRMAADRQAFAHRLLSKRLADPAARALLGRLTMQGVSRGIAPPDADSLFTLIELTWSDDPHVAAAAEQTLLKLGPEDESAAATLCERLLTQARPPQGLERAFARLRLEGFGKDNRTANRMLVDVALGRLSPGSGDPGNRAIALLSKLTGSPRDDARSRLAEIIDSEYVPADVYALLGRLRALGSLLGQPRYVDRNALHPSLLERIVDAILPPLRRWTERQQARLSRGDRWSPLRSLAKVPVASRAAVWALRVRAAIKASADRNARLATTRFSYNRAFATFALGAIGATIVGAQLDRVLAGTTPAAFQPLYIVGCALTATLLALLATRPVVPVHVHYDRAAGWIADVLAAAPWVLLPCLLLVTFAVSISSEWNWAFIGFVLLAVLLFVAAVRGGTVVAYPHTGWPGRQGGESVTMRLLRAGIPVSCGASAGLVVANWLVPYAAAWFWESVPKPIALLWLVLLPAAIPLAVAFTLADEGTAEGPAARAAARPGGQAPFFTGVQILAVLMLLVPLAVMGNTAVSTLTAPVTDARSTFYTAPSGRHEPPIRIPIETADTPIYVKAAFPQYASVRFDNLDAGARPRIMAYALPAEPGESGAPICDVPATLRFSGDARTLGSDNQADFMLGWGCYAIRSELRAGTLVASAGVSGIFAEVVDKAAGWLSASVGAPAADAATPKSRPVVTLTLNGSGSPGQASVVTKAGPSVPLDAPSSWIVETPHRILFEVQGLSGLVVNVASWAGQQSPTHRVSLTKVGDQKVSPANVFEDPVLPNGIMFMVDRGRYEMELTQGSEMMPLPGSSVVNVFIERFLDDDTTLAAVPERQDASHSWALRSMPTRRRFEVGFTQRVTVRALPESASDDIVLTLFDANGQELGTADDPEVIDRWLPRGTYEVLVRPYGADEPAGGPARPLLPRPASRYLGRLQVVLNVDRSAAQ